LATALAGTLTWAGMIAPLLAIPLGALP
jgi:hypothetical protein